MRIRNAITLLRSSAARIALTLLSALVLSGLQLPTVAAQATSTCTVIVDGGMWHDPATWDCGYAPTSIASSEEVLIPAGLSVIIDTPINVVNRGRVRVDGMLNNYGEIDNRASLVLGSGGQLTNQPAAWLRNISAGAGINVYSSSNMYNYGTLLNRLSAQINNEGSIANHGLIRNRDSGILLNEAGVVIQNFASIENFNQGTITNRGTLDNYGTAVLSNSGAGSLITNATGAALQMHDKSELRNSQEALLINEADARLWNLGAHIENSGATIRNMQTGDIVNRDPGSLLINDSGSLLENAGTLLNNNQATVVNRGNVTNECAGTITNLYRFANYGSLTNRGKINGPIHFNPPLAGASC